MDKLDVKNFAVYVKYGKHNVYIGEATDFEVKKGTKKTMPGLIINRAKIKGNFDSF